MWLALSIIAGGMLVGGWYGYTLWHRQLRRDCGIFAVMMAAALALAGAQTIHMPLLNPLAMIIALFSPVNRMLEAFFR